MAINKRIIRSNDEGGVAASFNTVLWTGDDSTNRQITGVGFQPDFVWIKNRDRSSDHALFDTVRGAYKFLSSMLTQSEQTYTNTLAAFDADGFTINESSAVNKIGEGIVAWCWKAGGAAVTNTDGDLTSQVSANTESGFSIVNYTGNDVSGNISVGHGLGITPKIVIQKNRSISSNWEFQTTIIDGSNDFLYLNDTRAAGNASQLLPESDVFWIRKDIYVNQNNSSNQYINYCFAEVAGFSKFGSYTGISGSVTVSGLGFEPAFLMIKKTNTSTNGSWSIFDSVRDDASNNYQLYPNLSNAENTRIGLITYNSDGFTINNNTVGEINTIGDTYIYMAFANQF